MKVTKNCIICNKCFKSYDVGRRKLNRFCSKICSNEGKKGNRIERIIRLCLTCGNKFEVIPSSHKKYCSKQCQYKSLERLNKLTDEEKFDYIKNKYEKFVIKKEGCWDWLGAKQKMYGCFSYFYKTMRAHRASWIIHRGPIPINMHVLHECDNPTCTNPDHLFLGTHRDNMVDMRKKEYHKQYSKLTLDEVREIKKLLNNKIKQIDIAKQFNVNFVTIHDIKHGKSWKNI